METFGSWETESLKFIKEVGRKIQENTRENSSMSSYSELSMTVQWGNAVSTLGTIEEAKKLEELYDLETPLRANTKFIYLYILSTTSSQVPVTIYSGTSI